MRMSWDCTLELTLEETEGIATRCCLSGGTITARVEVLVLRPLLWLLLRVAIMAACLHTTGSHLELGIDKLQVLKLSMQLKKQEILSNQVDSII